MQLKDKIYIAGHRGLVGSAICRQLAQMGFTNTIGRTSQELDLRHDKNVDNYFKCELPKYVFLAAGRVGGIKANSERPAEFIFDNLLIQGNVIEASRKYGVSKLVFVGSSCVYPSQTHQPIKETALLTGPLELTNQWYATAKIVGVELCRQYRKQYGCDFISAMPTNLYGPNDNYELHSCHVLPSLIRRFHLAKINNLESVSCWGSGRPLREFLFSDDLGRALIHIMRFNCADEIINIGSGEEVTIKSLSEIVASSVGYAGQINWDQTKPDGIARKYLDSSKIMALGWKPNISLQHGIEVSYKDFLENRFPYLIDLE